MNRKKKPKEKKKKSNFFTKVLSVLCCCFTARSSKETSLEDDDESKKTTHPKDKEKPIPRPRISQKQPSQTPAEPLGCSPCELSPLASLSGIPVLRPVRSCSESALIGHPTTEAEDCKRAASFHDLRRPEGQQPDPLWPVVSSISASFHQGSSLYLHSAWVGSQCTTMALVAVTLSTVMPVFRWARKELDTILRDGDRNHGTILSSLGRTADTIKRVGIYELTGQIVPVELRSGTFLMKGCPDHEAAGLLSVNPDVQPRWDLGFVSLAEGLRMALDETSGAVLTVGEYSMAVMRDPMGGVRLFDSHSRDPLGMFHPDGHAVLIKTRTLSDMEALFRRKLKQRGKKRAQFEVLGFKLMDQ